VNGNGSVNCVAFTPSGRVLTTGAVIVQPNTSVVLFDVGGIAVKGVCTASTGQVTLGSDGGAGRFINFDSDSSTKGHLGGTVNNGSSTVILDAGFGDRVSYEAQETFGQTLGGTADGSFTAGACIFQAEAIAANGASPPAGQAGVQSLGLKPRATKP
jgi:hypothetical protein